MIKKMFFNNWFSFIMVIITFLIGCFLFNFSSINPFIIKLKIGIIVFLPFILFLTIIMFSYHFRENKSRVRICNLLSKILSFFLLFYYFLALFLSAGIESMNPITNIKYYNKLIDRNDITKIFPDKIPNNALNVQFYYAPGFLQGGTEYALYYVDKNMTKEKFDNKYKEKAFWIGYIEDYTKMRGLLTGAFCYTPAFQKNKNDFLIYLTEGRCDDSGYCNHGEYSFAAFNEKTQEIIFEASYW